MEPPAISPADSGGGFSPLWLSCSGSGPSAVPNPDPPEPHRRLHGISSPAISPSAVQRGISSAGSLPGFSGLVVVCGFPLRRGISSSSSYFSGCFGGRHPGWSPALPPLGGRAAGDGCGRAGAAGTWWCLCPSPSRAASLDIVLRHDGAGDQLPA